MLRDFVEHVGLAFFAEAGLLLFLLVFITAFVGALRRPKPEVERLASMALDKDDITR